MKQLFHSEARVSLSNVARLSISRRDILSLADPFDKQNSTDLSLLILDFIESSQQTHKMELTDTTFLSTNLIQ